MSLGTEAGSCFFSNEQYEMSENVNFFKTECKEWSLQVICLELPDEAMLVC